MIFGVVGFGGKKNKLGMKMSDWLIKRFNSLFKIWMYNGYWNIYF